MVSPINPLSGLSMLNLGAGPYNLNIVYTMLDIVLFALAIVAIFVFRQINKSVINLKIAKCPECTEGLRFLFYSLYVGGAIFVSALISIIYARITYGFHFPFEISVVILILAIIAMYLLLKSMVSFSPEIKTRR